jgi:nucleoside-diphosphate-sugar epimerase
MAIRILITGASGFIGKPCVHILQEQGYEILTPRRIELDLFNREMVSAYVKANTPTHLLHLAWITTPGIYWTSPENQSWCESSTHLMREFIQAGGKRAVYIGTCAEYDWEIGGLCSEHTTPIRPRFPYSQAKHECHQQAAKLAIESGIELAWARLFFLYGEEENPARLVPSVINSFLKGEPALSSEGTQVRDFLYLPDVASSLCSLLLSRIVGPINIASGNGISIRSIVETIGKMMGKSDLLRLGAIPMRTGDPPVLIGDNIRLKDELKWVPSYSLEHGLQKTIDWWRIP